MKEDLISVIVTAYNIENYIARCMDSLLKQTWKSMEIILVDDGSDDGTGQICDKYAKDFENVRVIHQKNAGPSAARNAGVELAKGDYIGYVDGDDWVEPAMYEEMLRALLGAEADIAICSYREVGEGCKESRFTGNVIPLSRLEALEWYISGHEQYHIYHSVWSKLFRREVIRDIRFPEGRKSEDIMYTTRAMTTAQKCVFLDIPLYNYMIDRESSIMNSNLAERRFRDEIPFWKEQEAHLAGLGMQELADKSAYQFYRNMLFYYIDFCERKMSADARRLVKLLKNDKERIREVYGKDFVATGDKVRMKVFGAWPKGYYYIVKMYEKIVIPLRQ